MSPIKKGHVALISLALVATLFCSPKVSFAQGSSGKGATMIQRSPEEVPVLLDFVVFQPDYRDTDAGLAANFLPATPFLRDVGFDRIDQKTLPAAVLAHKRLELWRASSPIVVGEVLSALNGMDLRYARYRVEPSHEYFLPDSLITEFPHYQLVPLAYYDTDIGAAFSMQAWSHTGSRSQAGAIVHEGFRHVQNFYKLALTNEQIEKLTFTVMLRDPGAGETLDSEKYLGSVLKTAPFSVLAEQTEFDDKNCKVLKSVLEAKIENLPERFSDDAAKVCDHSYEKTAFELNRLCGEFFNASNAIDDQRLGSTTPLTDDQFRAMKDLANEVDRVGHYFLAASLGATLTTIEPSVHAIQDATRNAHHFAERAGEELLRKIINSDTHDLSPADIRQGKHMLNKLRSRNKAQH